MNLSDLANRDQGLRWRTCHTCALLDDLDPAQAELLNRAMANPLVHYSEIVAALAADGHIVGRDTIARHATGRCAARVSLR